MAKEISSLELRKHFGEIMEEVRYRKEPYIVKRNGRPMIVLLDIDVYQASKGRIQDEAFIEDYSEDRIREFLAADKLDRATYAKARKSLAK